MNSNKLEGVFLWVSGQVMTTGFFAFSVDLGKAFLLGLVGGLGGLVIKWAWGKIK